MNRLLQLLLLGIAALSVSSEDGEEAKPAYVAPPFTTPSVQGSPLLVDWFTDSSAIGQKWIKSSGKKDDVEDSIAKYNGEWAIGAPTKKVIDEDMGLIVKTKARHHAIATKFEKPFTFGDKPLVVQYEVKYEDGQECGGGYVKLLTKGAEQKLREFTDKTPYTIMFGPDKCGQTAKVHFIVRFKNPRSAVVTEHHAKQPSKPLSGYFDDHKTHLYTLVVRPDETFTVLVDSTTIMSGNLLNDLEPSIVPPTTIDDPDDLKPADWDEREKIDDPDAKKPDDWDDDAPKQIEDASATMPSDWLEDEESLIADAAAVKPEDWDDEMDGEWEAPKVDNPKCKGISGCGKWVRPMMPNPQYKGKWKAPRISNPAYKGKWSPRQIENPNFFDPHPFSQLEHTSSLGIELWTMSANIIIDNIFISDSETDAADFAHQTFTIKNAQEAAFESASAPSEGIVQKLVSATEDRPWLWAVYVLSVLIPVILIAIAFFGRKSRSSPSSHKKTDEPQPDDDEVPELVGDDEEGTEGVIDDVEKSKVETAPAEKETIKRTPSNSPSRAQKAAKTKAELEEDEESASQESSGDEEADEANITEQQSSPKGKRARQRRQD